MRKENCEIPVALRDEDFIKAEEIYLQSHESFCCEHDEEFKGCMMRLLEKENYEALGYILGSQMLGY